MPLYIPPIVTNGAISLIGAAFVVTTLVALLKLFLEASILKTTNPWHNPILWTLPFVLGFVIMIGGSILLGNWVGHETQIILESFTVGGMSIFGYKVTNGGKSQSPFGPLVTVTTGELASYESNTALTDVLGMMVDIGVIKVTTAPVANPKNPVSTEARKLTSLPPGHDRSLE